MHINLESDYAVRIVQYLAPVSYTHLDVYKRQGQLFAGTDGAQRY